MDAAAERVTLVHRESTRLTHYLHSLPQEAWSQPSACAQWQVQDVVTHLLGGAELYAGSIARGLQGDTSPQRGTPGGHGYGGREGRGWRPAHHREAAAVGSPSARDL